MTLVYMPVHTIYTTGKSLLQQHTLHTVSNEMMELVHNQAVKIDLTVWDAIVVLTCVQN